LLHICLCFRVFYFFLALRWRHAVILLHFFLFRLFSAGYFVFFLLLLVEPSVVICEKFHVKFETIFVRNMLEYCSRTTFKCVVWWLDVFIFFFWKLVLLPCAQFTNARYRPSDWTLLLKVLHKI
jgi:hypothetical protein